MSKIGGNINSEERLALARKGVEPYTSRYGYTAREEQVKKREIHLPRVIKQLVKLILVMPDWFPWAYILRVIFNSTAVILFLISPLIIFGKRIEPKEEEEFLKNHPCNTEDYKESMDTTSSYMNEPIVNVDGTPMVGIVDINGHLYSVSDD